MAKKSKVATGQQFASTAAMQGNALSMKAGDSGDAHEMMSRPPHKLPHAFNGGKPAQKVTNQSGNSGAANKGC